MTTERKKKKLLLLITCRVDHFSYTDWMHKMNLSSFFLSFKAFVILNNVEGAESYIMRHMHGT